MLIEVQTVRWQCSGCDRLCAMLLDSTITPDEIIICPFSKDKWRIIKKEE